MRTTRITEDDKAVIKENKAAIIYSEDGKRLLKVGGSCTPEVTVNEGTEIICDGAFKGNTTVKKVILPSTLQTIGRHAFEGCENLSYVFIPESITEIPCSCFNGCKSLEQVILHNGVCWIGQNAFEDCKSLRHFVFPSQLRTIDDFAFMHSGLETFCPTITEGVKCKIFDRAFAFCENMKTVTLTPGVQIAGEMSFICCKNLEEVTFTGKKQGLYCAVATMLLGCDNLKKITVPASKWGTRYNFNSKDYETAQYGHCDYNHLVVMEEE